MSFYDEDEDDERSPRGFAQIPRWLQRSTDVSAAAKLVYLALASRADRYGSCHPSKRLLAAEASVSVKTVERALQELRDLGVVTWEQRRRDNDNGLTSNEYTVHVGARRPQANTAPLRQGDAPPHVAETQGVRHTDVGDTSQGRNKNESQKNETQKNETLLLPSVVRDHDAAIIDFPAFDDALDTTLAASLIIVGEAEDAFAEFWSAWPRKDAKKTAAAKFRAAAKKLPPADIVAAAIAWLAARPDLEPQFVPHAATWLNQERWTDPPPQQAPPPDAVAYRHPAVTANLDLVAHFEAQEAHHDHPDRDREAPRDRVDPGPHPAIEG